MGDPRINQCMSCSFFKMTTKSDYTCLHWNANDPDAEGFCYDYGDLEDAAIDARDELIDRRTED